MHLSYIALTYRVINSADLDQLLTEVSGRRYTATADRVLEGRVMSREIEPHRPELLAAPGQPHLNPGAALAQESQPPHPLAHIP
ncbi:hypothetical protein ACIBBE_24135 [Streptomyces sp. NPDC051644]|uniref:hypothetical protein n=1 Tax=Streptomyces sp. NPDC051644 TaxID=3365666 RepID=UPI00378F7E0A